ncbi:hypothetical protein C5167_042210 [Papaver somniferum]|uniref:F-box associated beta-propeller type 3 domain-containing protein n=1 Tax=Papaver somniferum TaxID=3469 RepID=A0A4Y7L373_PAPSO|nr:hypothetical protein C5167_042210 [Papaver somniferum]
MPRKRKSSRVVDEEQRKKKEAFISKSSRGTDTGKHSDQITSSESRSIHYLRKPEPGDDEGGVAVINPSRGDTLTYPYVIPTSAKYLCHGFAFDPLSNEYKVVLIYTTTSTTVVSGGGQGFICMVFTLGTKSWRTSVTSTSEMSPPPGSSPFPDQMGINCRASQLISDSRISSI